MNHLLSIAEHLFAWVLKNSWEASLLAIVVCAIRMLGGRHLPARWSHALWLLVVVRLCMPALPSRPFAAPHLNFPSPTAFIARENPVPIALPDRVVTAKEPVPKAVDGRTTGLPVWKSGRSPAMLWLFGSGVLAVATVRQARGFARTLRRALPCRDDGLLELLRACAAELHLKRQINLVETSMVSGPAVVGHFRPTLLLPLGFTTGFSREEARVVFLHELAHLRRGDILVNTLVTGLQILHWFNPVLWWAFGRLRQDRELATDAFVLAGPRTGLQDLYARTLLKLVEGTTPGRPCPQALGIMEVNAHLKDRLTRITRSTPGAYRFSLPGVLLLGALGFTALTQETPAPGNGAAPKPAREAAAATPSENEADDAGDVSRWHLAGTKLSPEAVADLEKKVAEQPDDLAARVQILGFLFVRRAVDEGSRAAAQPHILWIIRHRPTSAAAGSPEIGILRLMDAPRYEEARQAWEEQLAKSPPNAAVIGNGASFFLLNDFPRAEELIRQAQTLEPTNTVWAERLGHFLAIKAMQTTGPQAEEAKRGSMRAYEQALAGKTDTTRFYQLGETAQAALQAGDTKQARVYATELLEMAPRFKSDWNYGNAIYTGNTVLGRISLQENDVPAARAYLLAAGETPGSPQLDSFGPDFTLAKQLAERGEKEPVAIFLGNIGKFWKGHEAQMTTWQEAVRSGENPLPGGR